MRAKTIVDRLRVRAVIAVLGIVIGTPALASAECGVPLANLRGAWCSVDGPNVRVWWDQAFIFEGDEEKAIQVRDYVERYLWPLYAKLLGRAPVSDGVVVAGRLSLAPNGGDGRYDIVLTGELLGDYDMSPLVPTSQSGAPPARFSMIRRTLNPIRMRGAVAHQLMRGFLTAFNCRRPCSWLEEATATWAEHVAYPQADTEHEHARWLLRQPMLSLHHDVDGPDDVAVPDRHKSGAYLFLFFLQHQVMRNVTFIRQVWERAEATSNPLIALDGVMPGGFKRVWREFIAANWNEAPMLLPQGLKSVPIYRAWDRLSTGVHRLRQFTDYTGLRQVEIRNVATTERLLNVTLPPLSAAYYLFEFDVSVRRVRIDHYLKTLRANGAEVVVFTKRTGEDWKFEPGWEASDSNAFCRDATGQRVEQMVIILGNSSLTSTVTFVAGSTASKLVASSASCLSDPDAGYEECRLEFPFRRELQSGLEKTYQNVETQRWEITGPGTTTTGGSVIYPYTWTTTGAGSSTRTTASTKSNADWMMGGRGEGSIELLFGQTPSGQPVRFIRNVTDRIKVADAVSGQDTVKTIGTSMKHTTAFTENWFEYPRPRSAPLTASRFEGFAVSDLDLSWAPGLHELGPGTIACRWHWPRKP